MKEVYQINDVAQIFSFLGAEGPSNPLIGLIPFNESWREINLSGFTYVLNLYQISINSFNQGFPRYGRGTYDFSNGTMVFTSPGQVIEAENIEEGPVTPGWVLLFHPDLIRGTYLEDLIDKYSFFSYQVNEALHISEEERASLTEVALNINEECKLSSDKHTSELILSNIELLLKYSQRFYERQFQTRTEVNQDLVTSFSSIVRNYYRSERPLDQGVLTVKECASALSMSVNYLGDLIRNETGRSARDHIQEHVIERAKLRLLGSSETISEIAYGLGFEYPQGLNKLFKNKVGMSPSEFRSTG